MVYVNHREYNDRGGVALCIKSRLHMYVKEVFLNFSDCIFVLIDKSLFGISRDILLGCIYVHPLHSSAKTDKRLYKAIDYIEDVLLSFNDSIEDDFVL